MVQAREVAGFGNMAKTIGAKWKTLEQTDPVLFQQCQEMKIADTIRYERELAEWLALKQAAATFLGLNLADNTLSPPDLASALDSDSDEDSLFDYDEPVPDVGFGL
jgi:hypothetical protein